MREIKFRAWLKEKKEIVNVEEIDFMNKVINYIENDYENNRQEIKGAYFENIVLMQYTGLKDKNNKEIYEGDILLSSNENGIFLISINFGDSNIEDSNILTCFQIKIEKTLAGSQYLEYFNNNLIELINKYNIPLEEYNNEKYISDGWWILGNIYENPELLKENNN